MIVSSSVNAEIIYSYSGEITHVQYSDKFGNATQINYDDVTNLSVGDTLSGRVAFQNMTPTSQLFTSRATYTAASNVIYTPNLNFEFEETSMTLFNRFGATGDQLRINSQDGTLDSGFVLNYRDQNSFLNGSIALPTSEELELLNFDAQVFSGSSLLARKVDNGGQIAIAFSVNSFSEFEEILDPEELYVQEVNEIYSEFVDANPNAALTSWVDSVEDVWPSDQPLTPYETVKLISTTNDIAQIGLCVLGVKACAAAVIGAGASSAFFWTVDEVTERLEELEEDLPEVQSFLDELLDNLKLGGTVEEFFEGKVMEGWLGLGSPADLDLTLANGTTINKQNPIGDNHLYIEFEDLFGETHDVVLFSDEELLNGINIDVIGTGDQGFGDTFSLYAGDPSGVITLASNESILRGETRTFTTSVSVPTPSSIWLFGIAMMCLLCRLTKSSNYNWASR